MSVLLRPYRADDAPAIAGLLGRGRRAAPHEMLARWREFARRAYVAERLAVAEVEGEVAGYAYCFAQESRSRPVSHFHIQVDPERRRRGIGSDLLQRFTDAPRAVEGSCLECEIPASWRSGAAFLEHHGFESRPSLERLGRALGAETPPEVPAGFALRRLVDLGDGGDLARWAELHEECFAGALHFRSMDAQHAASLARERGAEVWVLEDRAGEWAGYAHVADRDRRTGTLVELAVAPACRSRGFGKLLARAALAALAQRGRQRCELLVEAGAPHAARLYRGLGFTPVLRLDCWRRER